MLENEIGVLHKDHRLLISELDVLRAEVSMQREGWAVCVCVCV